MKRMRFSSILLQLLYRVLAMLLLPTGAGGGPGRVVQQT